MTRRCGQSRFAKHPWVIHEIERKTRFCGGGLKIVGHSTRTLLKSNEPKQQSKVRTAPISTASVAYRSPSSALHQSLRSTCRRTMAASTSLHCKLVATTA
ncbi:hypothetical protein GQ600_12641 [Phytophthora cactorum]|nr:hypothetical protein GQ600_12641 [Phytophthora cactorum]